MPRPSGICVPTGPPKGGTGTYTEKTKLQLLSAFQTGKAVLRRPSTSAGPVFLKKHSRFFAKGQILWSSSARTSFIFTRLSARCRSLWPRSQRVLRNVNRHTGLLCHQSVQSLEHGAAAGEGDAVVNNVGGQLRRGPLRVDLMASTTEATGSKGPPGFQRGDEDVFGRPSIRLRPLISIFCSSS